jgi:hypothetical protein
MNYPDYRPRRMRRTEALRRLVRETRLSVDDFVYPLFCVPGSGVEKPISSMPGQYNLSVDKATEAAARAHDLGIPAVLLFGIPEHKDAVGSEAWKDTGVVQKAIRSIKKQCPGLMVMVDGCFCEYTDHGHCGVLREGELDNERVNINWGDAYSRGSIQGVKGDKGAVGYFGLSYVEQNPDAIKAVEIDGGDGCVGPSKETVQDKTYKPLARPLYIYVKNSSYKDNQAVKAYVDFYVENEAKVAEEAMFVVLTPEQKKTAQDELGSIAA